MLLNHSTSADKNIVDRRQPHRNSDVARAVRKARDHLAQQAGNPDFDREMLKLHAHAMVDGAFYLPGLILLASFGAMALGAGHQMLAWGGLALLFNLTVLVQARHVNKTDPALINPARTKRHFLIAHTLSGFGWVVFPILDCPSCAAGQFPILQAVILLVAMAITALITSSLKGALLATFILPIAAIAYAFGWPMPVSQMMMLGLLIIALPFLSYIAHHLQRSNLMLLFFRSEKDSLIVDLETAKSMSDEARYHAEEANMAKSRFLATMSHELRTPLNAILGFSEVMAKEVLGPVGNTTYKDYASDIHQSGQHLLNLINEILDLSRIEAGRYQLQEEPVDLARVASDCCHMVELRAHNKNIQIIQDYEQALPYLFADERAIRQILLNLLSNAIKFTPSGGEIRIRVGWTAGGGQYISVKDNGPGIAPDELSVVLSAFGQGAIAIKSAEQGTGLGLPIIQGLIALHGGTFELHSQLREGAEAIAIFPPARVMEEQAAFPTALAANSRW
ncbi:sensor histidine kinase [Aquamicrobium segne]|uniref:histidine kinase n=1 Tax=Aquamicrobium segne TaxID=469547 RepID=A0ABW0GVV4_9HYPH